MSVDGWMDLFCGSGYNRRAYQLSCWVELVLGAENFQILGGGGLLQKTILIENSMSCCLISIWSNDLFFSAKKQNKKNNPPQNKLFNWHPCFKGGKNRISAYIFNKIRAFSQRLENIGIFGVARSTKCRSIEIYGLQWTWHLWPRELWT